MIYPFVSQNPKRIMYVSFSWTDSGLCLSHLSRALNSYDCRKWIRSLEFKILNESVCIIYKANTHRKCMDLTILPPTKGRVDCVL